MAIMSGNNGAIKTLGQMVGLLIALYVFDQIIVTILPASYACGQLYTADIINHNCYLTTNSSITIEPPSQFAESLQILQNLFSIVGIIGAFEVLYKGLKRSGFI